MYTGRMAEFTKEKKKIGGFVNVGGKKKESPLYHRKGARRFLKRGRNSGGKKIFHSGIKALPKQEMRD